MRENEKLNPNRILELSTGFLPAKVVLVATKLELFSFLAEGERDLQEIRRHYGFHGRGLADFLNVLVALDLLERRCVNRVPVYSNSLEAETFLNKNKKSYIGTVLNYLNDICFERWQHLEESLSTGQNPEQLGHIQGSVLEYIYTHPERMASFLESIECLRYKDVQVLLQKIDFSAYKSFCDLGGGIALLSIAVVETHPAIRGISFDLASLKHLAEQNIEKAKLKKQVRHLSGDIFEDAFPPAEVYCLSHVLQEWSLSQKYFLLEKAYKALPEGGLLVIIGNMLEAERPPNLKGLLEALNTVLSTCEGSGYHVEDLKKWARAVGFQDIEVEALNDKATAVLLYK